MHDASDQQDRPAAAARPEYEARPHGLPVAGGGPGADWGAWARAFWQPLALVFGLGLALGGGLGWGLGAGVGPRLAADAEPAPGPPFRVPPAAPAPLPAPPARSEQPIATLAVPVTAPAARDAVAETADPTPWPAPRPRPASPAVEAPPAHEVAAACGTKHACREMASCEEARFFLTQCGLSRLDRNGDGTPCESLCAGKSHRRARP